MQTPLIARGYAIALFIHILGVVALFAGFSMQQRAGSRLRTATTHEEARRWTEMLGMSRSMVPSGVVMLLVTGGYLAYLLGGSQPAAWISTAMVTALLIGIVAVAVTNRGFGAITRAVSAGTGPLSGEAARHIGSAVTWSALAATNGAALGTLWLMTAKPGTVESMIAVVLPAAIGAIVGARLGRTAPAAESRPTMASGPTIDN